MGRGIEMGLEKLSICMAAVLFVGLSCPVLVAAQAASAQATGAQATEPQAGTFDPVTRSPIAGTLPVLPKPVFPTGEREVSKFTVQFVYNFARYRYSPAVVVEPVRRGTATYGTPEEACIAFLSSMMTLDYDWWLENWDADSRKLLVADNEAHHQDAAFWHKAWQGAFPGKKVTLEQRLESGPYVLIVYHVEDLRDPSQSFSSALPFKLTHNQWLATEELAADNFSIYALDGRGRVEQSGVLGPMRHYDASIYDSAKGQAEFFAEYPKGKENVTTVVR